MRISTIAILLALLSGGAARAEGNLHMSEVTADGVEARTVDCRVDGVAGLFGGLAIVGALAKQKAAIDACAPGGAAFAIDFTWRDGKVASEHVTAGGSAKQRACIARALARVRAPIGASCSLVLLAGDKQAAARAADALAAR